MIKETCASLLSNLVSLYKIYGISVPWRLSDLSHLGAFMMARLQYFVPPLTYLSTQSLVKFTGNKDQLSFLLHNLEILGVFKFIVVQYYSF